MYDKLLAFSRFSFDHSNTSAYKMNVTFQISVLMAVVVAALCSSPPEDPGLRLITKLHKLRTYVLHY